MIDRASRIADRITPWALGTTVYGWRGRSRAG
ncbi:hypothetical protein J2853_002385 [Streptosporangium lutulentum]|uniref:Uncharacterized protein n=1 Tax=Streptosporangium lutulentum TaxID=1461250 RepID=A0ABT9QB72_9ACTN|nr:hypothetical protein [Streptosporangium lutulentum]